MFCIPSGGVNPSFGTLRVCCCGRKKLPFAGYSIVKELLLSGGKIPRKLSGGRDFSPGPPSAHFARGAQSPRSARSPELSILRLWVGRLQEQPVEPSARRGGGPPPSADARGIRKLNKMENTRLEPVTSPVRTRRSPRPANSPKI